MAQMIAFQGELGAYSHQACREARPDFEVLPCPTFEDVFDAMKDGRAQLAMIPIENTTYGRIADIHRLLPDSGLHAIDEAYVRVHINLLGLPGATLEQVKKARAMSVLLGQCGGFLRERGIAGVNWSDNAGAAREVVANGDPAEAALASELAAEVYGLEVLARHIEDQSNNTTRFLVMAHEPDHSRRGDCGMVTSLLFQVRNIPAALYKAMGGFATNGINMTKLESYMVGGSFVATQFFAEVEGHPGDPGLARALEELRYFTTRMQIVGVYPADPRRHENRPPAE